MQLKKAEREHYRVHLIKCKIVLMSFFKQNKNYKTNCYMYDRFIMSPIPKRKKNTYELFPSLLYYSLYSIIT